MAPPTQTAGIRASDVAPARRRDAGTWCPLDPVRGRCGALGLDDGHRSAPSQRQVRATIAFALAGNVRKGILTRQQSRSDAEPPSTPDDVADTRPNRDPRQSPILDWLELRGCGSASQIAESLGRKPSNVATRVRQLEQGGFVRRTGRTIPGGRGGPQIEWERCAEDKAPTDPTDVLALAASPPTTDDEQQTMRRAYVARLLEFVDAHAPEHTFERVERLAGLAP